MADLQNTKLAKKKSFFNQGTSTLHFLVLSIVFAVLLVVFGHPIVILNHTESHSSLNPQLQVALTTMAGLSLLIVSRFLLLWMGNRHSFSPAGYTIWIIVELIATVTAASFTLWQISGGGQMMLASLAADLLLGVITIESIPYIVSFLLYLLRQEHGKVLQLQDEIDQLQPERQAPAQPTGDHIINFHNKGNRLVFSIESKTILYIEAADNYTNIHYLNEGREDTYILHNSLKELELTLSDTSLIRCHRGYMVNINNVRRLQRKGHTIQLELNGSSKVVPVTKTYVNLVTKRLTQENQ